MSLLTDPDPAIEFTGAASQYYEGIKLPCHKYVGKKHEGNG